MPSLSFRLTSSCHQFEASEKDEGWRLYLYGECEGTWSIRCFEVHRGDESWSGFGAPVSVFVHQRITRSAATGIPITKPFDKDDKNRDSIHVTCPDSPNEKPFFQVSVSLPPDAFQRIVDMDWTSQRLTLTVNNGLMEQDALVSGDDPNGGDVDWFADKQVYQWLDSFYFNFSSVDFQQVSVVQPRTPGGENEDENEDEVKQSTVVEQTLSSVGRVNDSIAALRASIIKAAWWLAAILVVTAFIR